jgi:cell division transport system permease protein
MRERASHILPRDEGAAPLDFVIAVMAFLAALALGASLVATRAAHGWQSGLSDRLTVQVMPPEEGNPRAGLDAETQVTLNILRATPGIAHAAPLSDAEINALVEPWIGKDGAVSGIPLPRLIDAEVTPGEDVDVNALAVSFATRAGLIAHHEMVALLHQMGALPRFIARAMERHYFISALMAASLGTLFAALVFLGASGLEVFGVEAVPFLPPLSLKWDEFVWLFAVPVVTSLIAWATARVSVLSVVRAFY